MSHEIKTGAVAHGLFGSYPFPVESVYAIYSDRGQAMGRFMEVGYVAKTRAARIEWVVKNKAGQLWRSYGKTKMDAVRGADKDGWL